MNKFSKSIIKIMTGMVSFYMIYVIDLCMTNISTLYVNILTYGTIGHILCYIYVIGGTILVYKFINKLIFK